MKRVRFGSRWHTPPAHDKLMGPAKKILPTTTPLRSKSNKPLAMTTDDVLNILVYYHLNEFSSGRELLQNLEEDEYAKRLIAPAGGVKRSTFFDTVNERCVEQLLYVFYVSYKSKLPLYFPPGMSSLVTWWPLMGRLLTRSCQ